MHYGFGTNPINTHILPAVRDIVRVVFKKISFRMSNSNKIYSIVAIFVVTFSFVAKETDAFLLTQHGTNPLTDKSVFGHFTWGGEVSGKKNILGNVLNKLVIVRKKSGEESVWTPFRSLEIPITLHQVI